MPDDSVRSEPREVAERIAAKHGGSEFLVADIMEAIQRERAQSVPLREYQLLVDTISRILDNDAAGVPWRQRTKDLLEKIRK